MSDQFDLNKPCKDQGLTGDALMRCQEARNSARRNKIEAPKLDESGENKSKKVFGIESLEERRQKIDDMGFLNWYSNYTEGGDIMKSITDSWKNTDRAIMSLDNRPFGQKAYSKKDIEIRDRLLGSIKENFDAIEDEYKTGTGSTNDEAFMAVWRDQDGFQEKYVGPTGRSGDWKEESGYNNAVAAYDAQKIEKQDQDILKQYGQDVLKDFIAAGRDVMKMDLNAFDKETIDGLVWLDKKRDAENFLDDTGEADVSRILYPALDKYIYGEGDRDKDGFLPNERIAYENERVKQQWLRDGCGTVSTLEDNLKAGETWTVDNYSTANQKKRAKNCEGKEYKLQAYKTGDEYEQYKKGINEISKRGETLQTSLNTAIEDSKDLLDDLTDQKKILDSYGIVNGRTSDGIIPKPEIQAAYNADLKKYQELAAKWQNSPEAAELKKLSVQSDLINEEYKKLEELGEKYGSVAMVLEAGMLNYNLLDKLGATLSSTFVDPVLGAFKQLDATLGRAVGTYDDIIRYDEKGNVVEAGEEGYENALTEYEQQRGVAMNYFKVGSERLNQFSASTGAADFGRDGFTIGRYLASMFVDNSPSILAVLGPSAVAGFFGRQAAKGLTGMAAKKATQKMLSMGNTVTQSLFFVSGTTDQWGKLTLASYEGEKELKRINALLEDPNLNQAEKNALLKEQDFYLQTKDDALWKRTLSSVLYGGADMFAERYIGSMRVVKNLQKLGPMYKNKGLFGGYRKSLIDGVKGTIGSGYRFTAGIGAELLEESFVNLATAAVDRNLLGLNVGYLDQFSKDFALNTAFTSVVMQGPFMGQNVMAGLRYELATSADRKAQRTLHGKLMGIQNQINNANNLGLSENQVKELESQKEDLFNESTISDFLTFNNWTKLDQTKRDKLVDIGGEIREAERTLNELTGDPQFGSKGLLTDIKAAEAKLKELDAKKADLLKSEKLGDFEKQAEEARKENKELQTVDNIIAKSRVQAYEAALDITNFQFDGETNVLTDQAAIDNYIKDPKNKIDPSDQKTIDGINNNSAFVNPETGQIVVNQLSTYNTLMDSTTTSAEAFTAAIAPLHELLHVQIKKAGIFDTKGDVKLESSITNSVEGLRALIETKVGDGMITDERGKEILKRIDQYKGKDNKYNLEEVITTFSEAVIAGDLKKTDFAGLLGVKSMLNSVFAKINGGASSVLNPFTSTDGIFNFVSNFTNKLGDVEFVVNNTYTMDSTGRMKRETVEEGDLKFSEVTGKDIKSQLDQFVQNEDGSRKYESKEDFQKSNDAANAMNQIENTNLLDGLIRQNVSQEYLDMNPEFIQDAKQRIGEKFLAEFDPSKNESLFGWLTGPTVGGQAILGFAKGDVQNKGKQQVETRSIDDPKAKEVAEQRVDETTTTKKEVSPTIEVFDLIKKSDPSFDSKKFEKEFTDGVNALAKEKGINLANPNLTPKQRMDVVPYKVLADAIGIPVKKLTDPKANLTPSEASKAQRILTAAKPFIKNVVLSKANTDVTTVESKKKGGKPVKVGGDTLGLGTKILNTFFNPPKRLGSGKKVRTPKQFDNKKFDEAIGVKDGKVSPDFDARNSQIIKGLLKAVAEQMSGRATSRTLDAGPQTQDVKKTQAALDSMKSDLLFSKVPTNISVKEKKKAINAILTRASEATQLTLQDGQKYVNEILEIANNELTGYVGEAKILLEAIRESKKLGTVTVNGIKKPKIQILTKVPPTNNQTVDFQSIINQPDGSIIPFNVEVKAIYDSKGKKSGFQFSSQTLTNLRVIDGKTVADVSNTLDSENQKIINAAIAKLPIDNFISDMQAAGAEMKDGANSRFPTEAYIAVRESGGLPQVTIQMTGKQLSGFYTNPKKNANYIQLGVNAKNNLGTFSMGDVNPLGATSINDIKFDVLVRADVRNYADGTSKIVWRVLPQTNLSSLEKQGLEKSNLSMLDGSVLQTATSPKILFSKKPNLTNQKALKKENKTLEDGQKFKDSKKGEKAIEKRKAAEDKNVSKTFNDIIEENKGVKSEKRFSEIVAKRRGSKIGRFKFFLPPGAEDFKGLIYTFLGKGKKGEQQFEFFDRNLIRPYQQAVAQIERFRRALKSDYATLLRANPDARKKLGKKIPTKGKTDFTYDQAVRAYLMDKSGFDLVKDAGLSKRDAKILVDAIAKDQTMLDFAQGLQMITKQDTWLTPNAGFDVQTIESDLQRLTQGEGRKKFLENSGFMQNSGEIFSQENLRKIEATYGRNTREALEDMMYRMKNGTNRPSGSNRLVNSFNNWVNRSIGAIMFFNRKSALLQTISSVNFINWSDNNPLMAAKAFANQKQYWTDFAMIFNSPKLKERRAGLKGDINEAELAKAVEGATNKAEAALSWLLKKGFLPTQMADSFAIATGGATFYRNRVNTYTKQGMDQKAAEEKAFEDFSRVSEESQQSADPSMISQQQASVLGRLILSFQNTPMQYTRLMKRSAQDLLNGRGDAKTHVSKIIYYGAIQNFIFSALQNALFATIPGFSGEEEEDEETKKQKEAQNKHIRIANNMVDTVLRGSGIYGAIGATLKNTLVKFYQNEGKDPFAKDNADILLEAVNLSPPIGSKLRKLNNALKTREFEKDVIEERGWEITRDGRVNLSPSYRVLGSTAEAVLNIPLERTIAEISALTEMTDSRNSSMERIALALGWRTWDIGVRNEEHDQIKLEAKERKKEERRKKLQFEREEKKRLEEEKRFEGLSNKEINNLKRRDQIESLTKQQQVDSLVKLGLSKALIRSLRLESDRIDKIIELNTK